MSVTSAHKAVHPAPPPPSADHMAEIKAGIAKRRAAEDEAARQAAERDATLDADEDRDDEGDEEYDEEYDAEAASKASAVSLVLYRLHALRVDAQERFPEIPEAVHNSDHVDRESFKVVWGWWQSALEAWWAEAPLDQWQYLEVDLQWFQDHCEWAVDALFSRMAGGEVPPRRSKEEQRAEIEADAKRAARRAKYAAKKAKYAAKKAERAE